MNPPIRAVLFDLDGTLLDSVALILDAFRAMMREHHGEVPHDSVWLRGVGTPLVDQIRELADDSAQAARMLASYRAYYLAHHDDGVRAYAGVHQLVDTLHEAGLPMAIVTSKNQAGAQRALRTMGLHGHFRVVLGADDVRNAKPHPEPVLTAVERLGVGLEASVFVGDSTHDMAAGRAAGVRTAAVLWGPFTRAELTPHTPTWWVERPDQLLPTLGLAHLPSPPSVRPG